MDTTRTATARLRRGPPRLIALLPPALTTPIQVNPQLLLALALALAYHCSLSFFTFGRTYDAFVHIFFADHYARAWFDHWDYRWYTGFTMTSYPPGSQQTIALLAKFVGLRTGFVFTQTFAVLMVTVGAYRFACVWASEEAAGYAALLAVFSSSITETIHVFGQLPTMFSLGFLLNTLPFVYRWVREGKLRYLYLAWVGNAATTAGHHVTTLFGAIFFVAPVIVLALVESLREPHPGEPSAHPATLTWANLRPVLVRRVRRVLPSTIRAGVYGVGLVALLLLVVLPYWLWSKADPITQVSIPHASRDSFIKNINAGLVFWLVPYGLTLVGLPYAFYKGMTTKAWPMTLSLAMLVFLGTGGTTPFPKLLLGGAFDVLTLDRFTFWATITVLPLLGEFVRSLRHGNLARYVREQFGYSMLRIVQTSLLISYVVMSVWTSSLTQFRKFQPAAIDVDPIVTFLAKDEHWRWRYMTLGFGDQVAWLGSQTTATSVDGNYHSARRLPELTSTPVERLEGAKYSGIPGIGSLQQFMAVPDKYNLKFIFSNDQFYDPLLYFSGWHRLQRLENGIMVWERADIPALPEVLPRKEIPSFQRVMWGLVPMGALIIAMLSMGAYTARHLLRARRRWKAETEPELLGDRTQSSLGHWLVPDWAARRGWALFHILHPYITGPWRWVDGLLLRWSALPPGSDGGRPVPWQFWQIWLERIPWPRPAAPTARQVRSMIILGIALLGTAYGISRYLKAARTPTAVLQAYYDDLDFRRFDAAYARLDPLARPTYDQYLINLSLQGGLVASYGKLANVAVDVRQTSQIAATAEVTATWITALKTYPTYRTHEMHLRDGAWTITPDPPETDRPAEMFVRRPEVAWNTPAAGSGADLGPVPPASDRPEIQVLSSRLVRHDMRYSVVGELVNLDADPGDLTVTAILFDPKSAELSRYNAQSVISHKLLPREITPFRVDFEGVAGTMITKTLSPSFDPTAFTPPDLSSPVASFVVYAKAVVTQRDLRRDLSLYNLRITRDDAGYAALSGTLYNHGTVEATIPELLLTYYDQGGQVAWVDARFVERSVRQQTSLDFSVRLTPRDQVETLRDSGAGYSNQRSAGVTSAISRDERLALPPDLGYDSLRVSLNTFNGGT